jgi:hypothetical protein
MVIGLFTGCDIYICMYVVSEMRLLISVDVNSLDSLLAVTTAAGCWPCSRTCAMFRLTCGVAVAGWTGWLVWWTKARVAA